MEFIEAHLDELAACVPPAAAPCRGRGEEA